MNKILGIKANIKLQIYIHFVLQFARIRILILDLQASGLKGKKSSLRFDLRSV